MPDITLTTLQGLKQKGEKITMLTCYDATFAHTCCQAGVEVLLVGDSSAWSCKGTTAHCQSLPPRWPTTSPRSNAATVAP